MSEPTAMDQAVWTVLDDYEARATREEALWSTLSGEEAARRRDEMLLPVGRATGTLLNLLVKSGEARRILEVGSSYGYSTTWLAEGARAVGGKVTSLELKVEKTEYAARAAGARRAGRVRRVRNRGRAREHQGARGTL